MHINSYGITWSAGVLMIMIVTICGSFFTKYQIKFIHESGVAIILGLIASAIIHYGFQQDTIFEINEFLYIFLPAIIFTEAFSIKKHKFFKNILHIFLYGFIGTILTFSLYFMFNIFAVGFEWVKLKDDQQIQFAEIVLMSASLSSKDSFIAANMIDHHVLGNLHSIVFGEGLFNDASALALFQAVEQHFEAINYGDSSKIGTYFIVLGNFILGILIAGAVGLLLGGFSSFCLRKLKFLNDTPIGVVALIVCAFVLGHYAWYNLSEKSKITAGVTFQFLGTALLGMLFITVGISYFQIIEYISISLILFNLLFTIIIRIIVVGLIASVKRCFSSQQSNLNVKQIILLTYSGIPRGVLSYALASSISQKHVDNANLLKATIMSIVIFTSIIFGGFVPLVQYLLFKRQNQGELENNGQGHQSHNGDHGFCDDDHKDKQRKMLKAKREFSEQKWGIS